MQQGQTKHSTAVTNGQNTIKSYHELSELKDPYPRNAVNSNILHIKSPFLGDPFLRKR